MKPTPRLLLLLAAVMLTASAIMTKSSLGDNISSTIWQVLIQSGTATGSSIDSTIHPVIIASGSQLPATTINNAYLDQTVISAAGGAGGAPLKTVGGLTYGVEATLFQVTLPAGTFNPYDMFQCKAVGSVQNNSGATQNAILTTYVGGSFIRTGTVPAVSSITYRPWQFNFDMMVGPAVTANNMDGWFDMGSTVGVAGLMGGAAVATHAFGVGEGTDVDLGAPQTFKIGYNMGLPTSGATPTATVTALGTPALRLDDVWCWRHPGLTPTQTPTAAPT